MISRRAILGSALAAASIIGGLALPAVAAEIPDVTGEGMTIYFQMGGNSGDTATLARELGAKAAAAMLKVNLVAQYSGWDKQKMIEQASQALAAHPDAVIVMGHSGTDAMRKFLDQAKADGVIVVTNNTQLPGTGLSYFGLDNYAAGELLGERMVAAGLKKGDKAVVYGEFTNISHGDISRGTMEQFDKAGVTYDKLQWSNEAVLDPSLADSRACRLPAEQSRREGDRRARPWGHHRDPAEDHGGGGQGAGLGDHRRLRHLRRRA